MNSSTERINRVLLLWLDLQKAVTSYRHSSTDSGLPPWSCSDPAVARIWDQITLPRNQQALEEWMFQVGGGEEEVWAQQALMEARRRGKLSDPSLPNTDSVRS